MRYYRAPRRVNMNSSDQSPYRFDIASKPHDAEWDEFLEATPDSNHLQSSLWSQLKSKVGWRVLRLIARSDKTIVGGFQILHRRLPITGSVGYIPRGPVVARDDTALCKLILEKLDSIARTERLTYLAIQPPRRSAQFVPELLQHGFRPSAFELAPTATVLIDVNKSQAEMLAAMRKSRRRVIQKGLRGPITVRTGTERDLPAFHSLLVSTGRRHRFFPQAIEHFRTIWDLFSRSNKIVLFIAECSGEPVAGELDIAFGDTLVAKRAGWSGRHASDHPVELLVWAAINWAKQQGLKYYDMEGIDSDLARALIKGKPISRSFEQSHHVSKLGFGGEIILLPENIERVYPAILGQAHRNLWLRAAKLRLVRTIARQAFLRIVSGLQRYGVAGRPTASPPN